MEEQYSLYSEIDIEKHKKAYPGYLEVIIDEDGRIMYANPSHQHKLTQIACKKLGITRRELNDSCPPDYYADYTRWLCMVSGCVAVWRRVIQYGGVTQKQVAALRKLKMAGLYKGMIPEI